MLQLWIGGAHDQRLSLPERNRRDDEARARPDVSALTSADQDQRKMAELRRELQQLETSTALQVKSEELPAKEADPDSRLGPTVFADVLANGAPTRALVDTGSPATIISMDFVLNIFADQKDRQQHPEQVMKRFSPPEVSLRNYGGDPLSIISQTQLSLMQGSHTLETPVLAQKGAPHDLLLGRCPI